MNRHELVSSMNQATTELLREKGFVSFVDVLIRMGKLTKEDHDAWRMRRIPYLERAIRLNLNQLSHLLRTLRQNAVNGKLKPSKTVYVSWGKGGKQRLQFSKSGHPRIEEAYSTHFVKQVQGGRDNSSDSSGRDPKVADPVNYRTAVISAEPNDMMDSGQGEPVDLLG